VSALDRFLPRGSRQRAAAGLATPVVVLLLLTQFVFPGTPGGGRGTPMAILFAGLLLGLTVAVFASSVVLIYRTLRFINFALGPIGITTSTLLSYMLVFGNVPFPIALPIALAVGGGVGAILGLFTLRFFRSSRLFLTVVTITASGTLLFLGNSAVARLPFWPSPEKLTVDEIRAVGEIDKALPFQGLRFFVGSFETPFGIGHLLALELGIISLIALVVFLRYTRVGTAMRAMAENRERAALLGIGVGGLSILAWTIAGVLDTAGAVMARTAGVSLGGGFAALLPPFAAAVFGRFRNVGTTIYAALLIGVAGEAFQFSFRNDQGMFDVLLFVMVAVGLLVQRKQLARAESAEMGWASVDEPRPVPKELSGVPALRIAKIVLALLAVAFVILFPLVASTGRVVLAGVIVIHAITVLSLVVLTGWAGQVSLGQFALVAVGSVVCGALTAQVGVPFWLAIPLTIAVTAGVALLVGLPALRIKGLFLLVTTFAFAVAVERVLFDRRYFGWLLPREGVDRPTLFFIDFENETAMYFLLVVALIATIAVVMNLRRSRIGRLLIAMRESEANVQSFGVSPLRLKLLAFGVSGGIAGFAGALFSAHARGVGTGSFGVDQNVNVFIEAVVGGVTSPVGALLGSAYIQLSQDLLQRNAIAAAFVSTGGPLLILFIAPGGLVDLVNRGRDAVLRIIAQRRGIVVPSLFADYDPEVLSRRLIPLGEAEATNGLSALPPEKRFTLRSELYRGKGERVIDKLRPTDKTAEAAALGAAAQSALEAEDAAARADVEEQRVEEARVEEQSAEEALVK
jgi:branched-chain amino acid transport system permease protein